MITNVNPDISLRFLFCLKYNKDNNKNKKYTNNFIFVKVPKNIYLATLHEKLIFRGTEFMRMKLSCFLLEIIPLSDKFGEYFYIF